MTIHVTEPEVPRAFPHARLYLDDIEQIIHILSDVAKTAPGTPQPPQPTFRVGNKETDEIEDLPKITKRTRDLTIRLETQGKTSPLGGITLIFQVDRSGPHWLSAGLPRADAWQTYPKLEEIIRPRVVVLGVLARTLPGILFAAIGVAATLGAFLILLAAYVLAHKFPPHSLYGAAIVGLLQGTVAALGFILTKLILTPRSTVTLRYSYDQAARREERNSKLLFAVLGFSLGVVGTLVSLYLSRLIWPSH